METEGIGKHIVAALAIVILLAVAFFLLLPERATEKREEAVSSIRSSTPSVCTGCITSADNGETFEETATSHITLELPEARFPQEGLAITPADMIGETFGASPTDIGNWVRTFEVLRDGTALITVPAADPTVPAFHIVIHVAPPLHPQSTSFL